MAEARRRFRIVSWLGILLLALAGFALFFRAEILQSYRLARLFDAEVIVHNFQNMDENFPTRRVERGSRTSPLSRGVAFELPATFLYEGKTYDTESFLDETVTTGLIILHDDAVVYERYERGHSALGRHIAWSVSKSVVSALMGIAVDKGLVEDLTLPVTQFLPELEGSGYDGVPIKHVLQMSSGVRFNEDYGDPGSDINRMGRVMAWGTSLLGFAASLQPERPSGTYQHYVSIDTQVLGTILVRVTGKSLAELTSEWLWKPMGMEADAYWIMDGTGMEMALGGLNAALRDYARFGSMYLHGGRWAGQQIVPADWVRASVTPDAPHLMPGPNPNSSNDLGYGYQWWIPTNPKGEFMALGVYNQMIFVDTVRRMVIAKNSANREFQRNDFQATRETVELYRTIGAALAAR